MIKNISYILAVLLFFTRPAAAQQQMERKLAVSLLQQSGAQYKTLRDTHINVDYYYANESTPDLLLDSFKSVVVVNGDECSIRTPATETVVNSGYSITLFQEDKLMYLARKVNNQPYNPLSLIDSLFNKQGDVTYSVRYNGDIADITIVYPPGQEYKSIHFSVDTARQFRLLSSRMVLKSAFLTNGEGEAALLKQKYSEYALVEVRFSGYRREALSPDYFSESRFFYKKDGVYHPATAYSNYTIFLGTPNL